MARTLGQSSNRDLGVEGQAPSAILCQQGSPAFVALRGAKPTANLTYKALVPDPHAGSAVAAVVHELRQPLASMLCNIQASIRWLDRDEPQVAEALQGLKDSAELARQMGQISSALLETYSRRVSTCCDVPLDSLVAEVTAAFAGELQQHGISIQLDLQPGISVQADHTQLYLVLRNLVSNAIDAISSQPSDRRQICLAAYPMTDRTVICVIDTGPGITESYQAFISEPFFTTKANGMGMGLSICETILSRYDTALRHTVSRRGETVFMFAIPAPGQCGKSTLLSSSMK